MATTDGHGENLQVAVTGATGLIGRRLCALLKEAGHGVYEVKRVKGPAGRGDQGGDSNAYWNVETGEMTFPGPVDVLVHLAGRTIATRWSAKAKREIFESRGPATERLCAFLARQSADKRPGLLISTSAIGIYGDRGDEVLTETSAVAEPGVSFQADVCRAWEVATRPVEDAIEAGGGGPNGERRPMRVIHPRIGVVLARGGGALAKMLTPAKLGLAGPVGPGTQFIPWISLTDVTRLLAHLALSKEISGVINAVGLTPVRQHEFIRTLGGIVHRPTVFPMPGFMVKLLFGEMGVELLLGSLRVISTRIPAGFVFEHQTLEAAMRAELRLPK